MSRAMISKAFKKLPTDGIYLRGWKTLNISTGTITTKVFI